MYLLLSLLFIQIFCFIAIPFRQGECRKGDAIPEEPDATVSEESQGPWFTGPLITPSGHAVPIGYVNIEPYLFFNTAVGTYNENWKSHSIHNQYSLNPQVPIQIGLTSFMDIQFSPQLLYNFSNGHSAVHMGDLPVGFDFQLLQDTPENYVPGIKLNLRELFPIGKYQKLSPHKGGVDATGGGSFVSSVGLVFSRLFHTSGVHYLATRLALDYDIPAPVHVKDFNTYGGGYDTRGKVYPGNIFRTMLGLEYSLTKNWALALDVVYFYGNKIRFSGNKGVTSTGQTASVGSGSWTQISLAPAFEYNWNASVGLIAGVWFTVAGRNTSDFISGVVALNYYGPISFGKSKKQKQYHSHGGTGNVS